MIAIVTHCLTISEKCKHADNNFRIALILLDNKRGILLKSKRIETILNLDY